MSELMQVAALKDDLKQCRQILNAIGSKTRLGIICTMFEVNCKGMRVGEIARYSKLSRPAVTHHLKILLAAEVIGRYVKGTRSYYYMKLGGEWTRLVAVFNMAEKLRLEEIEKSE